MKRREFLVMGAGAILAVNLPSFVLAKSANFPQKATACLETFGEGIKLTGVLVEYQTPFSLSEKEKSQFAVVDRHILSVENVDASGKPVAKSRFVKITLDPQDANASLVVKQPPSAQQMAQNSQNKGPGKAGDKKENSPLVGNTEISVIASGQNLTTKSIKMLGVEDFVQREFKDEQTGKTVRYNLFVPENYDETKRYPLVNFMHDAGVTGSNNPIAPLIQGNGATAWAKPEFQAKHPCFVLAPQFDEIIADDDSKTSDYLDATINLIKALVKEFNLDENRLYTTGQSGGGMLSIAMNVKYPDFFAASYLVACQWDEKVVAPMAKNKLWITVSEDDSKAFPGQTAIVKVLAENGAKVARATWNAQWDSAQFQQAFDKMSAEKANVNFVVFEKGSVFKAGEDQTKGGGHTNTWKYAYNIEPVLDWILEQHK